MTIQQLLSARQGRWRWSNAMLWLAIIAACAFFWFELGAFVIWVFGTLWLMVV